MMHFLRLRRSGICSRACRGLARRTPKHAQRDLCMRDAASAPASPAGNGA